MQKKIQEMTALPTLSQYPLKIKIQQSPSEAMQILSANISVQIKPAFHFQTREIGQILALKSKCAQKSTVNKNRIGFRIGSDRIGICRTIIFEKKLF